MKAALLKDVIKIKENLSEHVKELLEEQLSNIDKLNALLDTDVNMVDLQIMCVSIKFLNEELFEEQLPKDLESELISLNNITSLILNKGGYNKWK